MRHKLPRLVLAAFLGILASFIVTAANAQTVRPTSGPFNIAGVRNYLNTSKFPRTLTVCATGCDYTTLALAYTYVGTQTRDSTHHWMLYVFPDATISSPGSQPTFTSVQYVLNTPSTSAVVTDGQTLVYVAATNSWVGGSAVAGGAVGPGSSTDNAITRFDSTTGALLQNSVVTLSDLGAAAGTATLAGNPAFTTTQYGFATTGLIFEGATADTVETLLLAVDPTSSDKTVQIPNASGVLALSDGATSTYTLTPAAAGSNVSEVTITAKDASAATVAATQNYDIWLSDSATCAGLTATTASGTVTAKTASGIVLATYTAKKALRVQSLDTGVFVLEITDSAKTGFYVCVQAPYTGKAVASAQLVTGDYGS